MGLRELIGQGRKGKSNKELVPERKDPAALKEMREDKAWAEVDRKIKADFETKDKWRRDSALNRRRLYEGRGLDLALATVDEAFKDPLVRSLYKSFSPFARVNYLRRKTRERSRLYAKAPLVRQVAGVEDNVNYLWVQLMTTHNQAMKFADETTDYQNDTFWLYRVRNTPQGLMPRTDIVGPESFFAIADPKDSTSLIAIGVDRTPSLGKDRSPESIARKRATAHWVVWSDEESFHLDGKFNIIRESIEPNPFGRIPGVLVNNGYRDRSLLDPFTGQEAVSTHLSLWLQETMKLKGISAKTRQAVFTGETGNSPTGQPQDDTRDMQVAEGVGVTTVERGIDVDQYIAAADHTEERAAASEGITTPVLRGESASSGYQMDLNRIPLEEIREDRVEIFRRAERAFAEVQSIVMAVDMPSRAFDTTGWHMDYAEIKRPRTDKEKWEVRQVKRKMGHSDPVLEAQEDNPDFTEDQAKEWVEERMTNQAAFELARAQRNSPANPMTQGQTPQQNGAMGGPQNGQNGNEIPEDTDTTAS